MTYYLLIREWSNHSKTIHEQIVNNAPAVPREGEHYRYDGRGYRVVHVSHTLTEHGVAINVVAS